MNKYKVLLASLFGMALVSCNDFLDTLPDRRTEINSPEQIKTLLVSAYPRYLRGGFTEQRTDNVTDRGSEFGSGSASLLENYYWKPVTAVTQDSPNAFWNTQHLAISHANFALEAIDKLGGVTKSPELSPLRGEALICRAYANYGLVSTFAQAYNSQTSNTDLGIPSFLEIERNLHSVPTKRQTVAQNYAQIAEDIEAGFPLIEDAIYTSNTAKYHFNRRAAAAFAAEFYLAYEQPEKALQYANIAVGDDPRSELRNWSVFDKFVTLEDNMRRYITIEEPANLFMIPATTNLIFTLFNPRYAHSVTIARTQTVVSSGPWGKSLGAFERRLFGRDFVFLPKIWRIFVYDNVQAQTGMNHGVYVAYTVDKALLARAEAKTLLGRYDSAAEDLKFWYASKGAAADVLGAMTPTSIADFYDPEKFFGEEREQKLKTVAKALNPRFAKPLEAGVQTGLIQAVLHARRIETIHEGSRWDDIKRYGIRIEHEIWGEEPVVLEAHDLRKAIQIPDPIVASGVVPNPR